MGGMIEVRFDRSMMALTASLGQRRVTPELPFGRVARVVEEEPTDVVSPDRDAAASWSAFIRYVDAKGHVSDRRFTCRELLGFEGATHVSGFCHERRAPRMLVIDRIEELVCCETGEVLDPFEHFDLLRRTGALGVDDGVLTDVARVLVFLARCDGEYHPFERAALERHLERYCVRFNGTDAMVEAVVRESARLAPDALDLLAAVRRIAKAPGEGRVARFVLDCGADIVDADGHHSAEEVQWALELSGALKAAA